MINYNTRHVRQYLNISSNKKMCIKTEETAETVRRFLTKDNILEELVNLFGFSYIVL